MAEDPDQIDLLVGTAMRTLRRNAGMTQAQLGKAMGVKFQQVQKYETGKNRVSASRLRHAADALGASVSEFYGGLGDTLKDNDIASVLADSEALKTACAIHAMPDAARQGVLNIVAVLAAHAA